MDKFFYWVDICLLSGFLSSFQKKTRKTVYLCVKQNNFYEKTKFASILVPDFCLCRPAGLLYAVQNSSRFSLASITINDGLPYNFVDDIIKSDDGYLWVATYGGGVARYDGNEFVVFNTNTTDQRRLLRSNFVEKLAEDAFHRIWVAGESGIELLSTENLQLLPVESLQSEEMAGLMKAPVSFLMTTRTGNLWLCSRGHIYKVMFNSTGTVKKSFVFRIRQYMSVAVFCMR